MTIRFAWDPAKAESNRLKHRITFEVASRVFADPYASSLQDRIEDGEHRWQTIGLVDGVTIVLVAHTILDADDGTEIVRIISARRADRQERRRYEQDRSRRL
ncbi:hypothetical protein ASF28_03725 [Methylobacterium sp. Leaf99]|uniref:BrnT family toxin n=1 Tax=Methylobacterium sp. Leaf99 TaxID=1736251 RepID=UPI0006FE4B09|nr:BrnT family toxin [Methylobacterium sp. Leaf99]KQP10275.1 hypothetical protein ASF28_03725 [Methylobacterium sp. Leaf99]